MTKQVEHWQVEILYDEMQGPLSHKRFTDWEKKFITSLMGEFFNNPDYKLWDKQKKALDNIWGKD